MTVGNDLVANLRATLVGPSLLHRLQFEEGWKHGNLEIQNMTNGPTERPTDLPTRQGVESRVRDWKLKIPELYELRTNSILKQNKAKQANNASCLNEYFIWFIMNA